MASGGLIVDDGRNFMWQKLYGINEGSICFFRVGVGSSTVTLTQSGLDAPIAGSYPFVSGYPIFDTINKKATTRGFLSSTEANGSQICEAGLFCSNGSMWSRDVFTGITKTGSTEIAFIWTDSAA